MITTIISGGQVGADIAGLRAAKKLGVATGGCAPFSYMTKLGPQHELGSVYGLIELGTFSYPARTKRNVMDSDGTIQFAHNWKSPGELATSREIRLAKKPYFQVAIIVDERTGFVTLMQPHPEDAAAWIKKHDINVLNVSGNANQKIEDPVQFYMQYLIELTNE